MIRVNGEPLVATDQRSWYARSGFTGTAAPDVVGPWYNSATASIRTEATAPNVTFITKQASRSNAGDIIVWTPALGKRPKVLKYLISGTAAALVAIRENTAGQGSDTPTWVTREEMRIPIDGTVLIPFPEQFFGPADQDPAGPAVKLEVISGTGTFYGTLHGFEG